jgi:hypothetical protein
MAFYEQEPWGYEANTFPVAQLAATVVNTTPRGRGARVFKAEEFYHRPWTQSGEGLTQEQLAFIRKRKPKRGKK